jgi:predicted RNA binding protein YcfA (HicA-like mRNA interferase family)
MGVILEHRCHLRGAGRMSRREKLLGKMRASPGAIRFSEVEALLRHEGFVLFNARGSHRTFHRADGRLLTIVRPHGGRKTCHPDDIRKILEALAR